MINHPAPHIFLSISKRLLLFFLLLSSVCSASAVRLPAYYSTNEIVFVRKGPDANSLSFGLLPINEKIVVQDIVVNDNDSQWGVIAYNDKKGYVPIDGLTHIGPYHPEDDSSPRMLFTKPFHHHSGWIRFWQGVWKVLKIIFTVLAVILVFAFWNELLELAVYAGFFAGAGALLFSIFGGDGGTGATVGLIIAALVGLRYLLQAVDIPANIFGIVYFAFSTPIALLNRLEHFLVAPWRYVIKTSWIDDGAKPVVRGFLELLTVVNTIAITPLRLLNAFIYNIVIHCAMVLLDLLSEVMTPSDSNEGYGHFGRWLLMLPWRFIKYPIYHGLLTVIESVIWTVVDIFIPAATMYHGTDLTAADAIVCDSHRNNYLKSIRSRSRGNFMASQSSWGGIGVYFASKRLVAFGYANDSYRLSDDNPVIIVCRVSLGRTLNYALAPEDVYNEAGGSGTPSVLNRYCERHHYTTGEWWNRGGGYWEYCMLDWQNGYNHPWRIRPIYVYNLRTQRPQHIQGGMQHWLFYSLVWKNIFK